MSASVTSEGPAVRLEDLQQRLAAVEADRDWHARAMEALVAGGKAILGQAEFAETARALFDFCCEMTGATSGYVALLSEDGTENEVLFLEAGGMPCSVDPSLPMPIRGLRAEAYRENRAVYHNDFMNSSWAKLMPAGHCVLKNVMFAPLVVDSRTVGIIGLANKEGDFDDRDAFIAGGFGELAAIALCNSREVEARERAQKELECLASTDSLTGLANRRIFLEAARDEVQRSRRYGRPLSCLMLDLDRFKDLNDRFGHQVGDAVLRAFAVCGAKAMRRQDLLGRLGGEEFAALLPETGTEQAARLAERLLEDVRQLEVPVDGRAVRFTVSAGVAQVGPDEAAFDDALKRADRALYRAKERGRDRVCVEGV